MSIAEGLCDCYQHHGSMCADKPNSPITDIVSGYKTITYRAGWVFTRYRRHILPPRLLAATTATGCHHGYWLPLWWRISDMKVNYILRVTFPLYTDSEGHCRMECEGYKSTCRSVLWFICWASRVNFKLQQITLPTIKSTTLWNIYLKT